MRTLHILICTAAALYAAPVHAQAGEPSDARTTPVRPHLDAAASASEGLFLPSLIPPGSERASRVHAAVWAGYDSAHEGSVVRSFVDATVYGPLSIRAGISYLPETPERSAQPHVGARLSLLNEDTHGLALGVGAFYRMERFTQEEGLAQALLSVGKHFGRTGVFANVVYGQDVEGDDREGELLVGVLHALSARLQLGVEARARFNLGSSDEKRREQPLSSFDAHLAPTLSYALGPLALFAEVGPALARAHSARTGLLAMFGLGGAL